MKQFLAKWFLRWSLPKLAALGCALFGAALVLMGLLKPWMVVPVSVEGAEVSVRDAAATPWWKAALVTGLMLAAVCWWRAGRIRGGRWAVRVLALLVPLLLAFPQAVIIYDADTSGDLTWLQQQHDSMTWLGGDVYLAHGSRYQQTAPVVDLEDPPLRLAAFRPPTVAPWSLGIAAVQDLVWWLGYNPAYCQFVARGWIFSVLGLLLGIAGWLGWRRQDDEAGGRSKDFRACASALAIGLMTWLALALIPILTASYHLNAAKSAALNDDPLRGRIALQRACRAMPALGVDTGIIWQLGSFDMACGDHHTARARLHRIQSLQEDGYPLRAQVELGELVVSGSRDRAVDREISRMLMQVAINDVNSGRMTDGRRRMKLLCEREPTALQARFHLQLLTLHAADVERNRRCRDEVAALYQTFQRKNKKGVLSASWLMLAQGELAAGNVVAAAEAREKSRTL